MKALLAGVLYTTSKFATGQFAHDSARDGLSVKKGAKGQGFGTGSTDAALTYCETNYEGEIKQDVEVVGVAFHIYCDDTAAALATGNAITELRGLSHNVYATLKHSNGNDNISADLGPLTHFPSPYGVTGDDASTAGVNNASSGRMAKMVKLQTPIQLMKGDTPTIEYKPGIAAPNLTLEWRIQAILLVQPV